MSLSHSNVPRRPASSSQKNVGLGEGKGTEKEGPTDTGEGLPFPSPPLLCPDLTAWAPVWPCGTHFTVNPGHQAPRSVLGPKKVRHTLFLWTYFLSRGQEETGQWSVLRSLFCGTRRYWLFGKRMGQKGCSAIARKVGQNAPSLSWQRPTAPTHLLAFSSATQPTPHQDEGRGHFSSVLL